MQTSSRTRCNLNVLVATHAVHHKAGELYERVHNFHISGVEHIS